jgi:hypothetical protein
VYVIACSFSSLFPSDISLSPLYFGQKEGRSRGFSMFGKEKVLNSPFSSSDFDLYLFSFLVIILLLSFSLLHLLLMFLIVEFLFFLVLLSLIC